MGEPRTIWGDNGGVRIEALEWAPDAEAAAQGLPLVYVPGGTGNARGAAIHGRAAARLGSRPRRVLGVSRRGMGNSDAPSTGFRPADFAGDVRAAIAAARYERFVLFGHSMGVPISIEIALGHPGGLAGLVLGDGPARYIDFKADGTFDRILRWPSSFDSWDEAFDALMPPERRRPESRAMFDGARDGMYAERDGRIHVLVDREALLRTVEQSVTASVNYAPRLGDIEVPVLLILSSSGWSPVEPGDAAAYESGVRDVRIARLDTGHDLGQFGDAGPLHAELGAFLDRLDR
jgi:pimeloyl-ACP methyl ester carboxylesterase